MDREEALSLLKKKLKNNNLVKHCLAVEAAMRGLARYFGEDEERWGLAGLAMDCSPQGCLRERWMIKLSML